MAGYAPPLAGSIHNPPGGELNWSMKPAQESFRPFRSQAPEHASCCLGGKSWLLWRDGRDKGNAVEDRGPYVHITAVLVAAC